MDPSSLPEELFLVILGALDRSSLLAAACVSQAWRRAARDGYLWRQLSTLDARATGKTPATQARLWLDGAVMPQPATLDGWWSLHAALGTVHRGERVSPALELAGVASSSCDTDGKEAEVPPRYRQDISKVMADDDRFWSCVGTTSPDDDEWLTFQLVSPLCLVTAVEIAPYRAGYQSGLPCYAPLSASVSVGFSPDDWHYTSRPIEIDNEPEFQAVPVAPALAYGAFVRVNLHGRHKTEPGSGLWYTVLRCVRIYGVPLANLGDLSDCGGIDQPESEATVLGLALVRSAISRPSFATTFNRVCPNADALLSDDEVAAVQAPVARQQSVADRAAFEAVVHRVEKVLRIGTSSLRATLAEDQAVLSSFADILTLDPLPSDKASLLALSSMGRPALYTTRQRMMEMADQEGKLQWYLTFFAAAYFGKLTAEEALRIEATRLLAGFFVIGMIESASEALGDRLMEDDVRLALRCYERASVVDKVILCLLRLGRFALAVEYVFNLSHMVDWPALFAVVAAEAAEHAAPVGGKAAGGEADQASAASCLEDGSDGSDGPEPPAVGEGHPAHALEEIGGGRFGGRQGETRVLQFAAVLATGGEFLEPLIPHDELATLLGVDFAAYPAGMSLINIVGDRLAVLCPDGAEGDGEPI